MLGSLRLYGLALQRSCTRAKPLSWSAVQLAYPATKRTSTVHHHHMDPDDQILASVESSIGVLTLNRPKALNSLNKYMVDRTAEVYSFWNQADSPVNCIIMKGAGEKAFCAGGDVKGVVQSAMAGDISDGREFFRSEYRTDHAVASLHKPHVALIDGIIMGGGAGISMHGAFRVATDRTLFAMPECGIGLFPDVGASHFLQRLPGSMGTYLALTGARLKGYAVKEAGLATHYLPHDQLPLVRERLAELGTAAKDLSMVNRALCELEAAAPPPSPTGLLDKLPVINDCFSKGSVEQVAAALKANTFDPAFSQETLQLLLKVSPLSTKVTLELLRRMRGKTLAECLRHDYRLAVRFTRGEGDFWEGVRVTLIDRGQTPKWKFPTLDQVPHETVAHFFEPLEDGDELQLPPSPKL